MLYKKSKFFSICLPDTFDDSIGYHTKCYKDFTLITIPSDISAPSTSSIRQLRQSTSSSDIISISRTRVFAARCLFFLGATKHRKGKLELLGSCMIWSGIDLIAKEVKYHHLCHLSYRNKAQTKWIASKTNAESNKMINHILAISSLKTYTQQNLLDIPGAELLNSLHEWYLAI